MLITNDVRDDGFGAQYQSIIWSILFAEVNGHTFYYSPIRYMCSDISDNKKFIENAEKLMNIKDYYPYVYDVYSLANHTVYALKAPLFFKEIETNMEHFHNSKSFEKIKFLFYMNNKNPYDTNIINIAVHIRRPVSFDTRIEGANIPDSYFLRCMENALYLYSSEKKQVLFHIYSQGKEEKFQIYKKFPVQFHLEDDTFSSFIGMVYADLLIISPSSFSYTAGLLSNGKVVYKPFWHPPRSHWLMMN